MSAAHSAKQAKSRGSTALATPPDAEIKERLAAVEEQVKAQDEQISFLLKGRPGRKYLPIVKSEDHVCGVDPDRDSETCPDASLWRRNKGCLGDACVAVSTEYYRNYRKDKKKPE